MTRNLLHAKIPFVKPFLIITYADLTELSLLRDRYQPFLSAYRIQKMSRLKSASDRDRGELAEYCLVDALLRYDPAMHLPKEIQTTSKGKPYFLDSPISFSLSHSGDYAAAAISDEAVGIDIERQRPVRETLARRISTDREWEEVWLKRPGDRTFLELFSGKESIVKRSGQGLADISKVEVCAYPVMQQWISDYLLSVCSERTEKAEVINLCDPK